MALLSQAQIDKIVRVFMRRKHAVGPYLKATLTTAATNADGWADSNSTSYNNALVAAFRNNATLNEKTILLALVVLERAGILDNVLTGVGD